MPDDPLKTGQADRDRISVQQAHEIAYWTQALDCTEEELKEAVRNVGHMADDVRRYFETKRKPPVDDGQ